MPGVASGFDRTPSDRFAATDLPASTRTCPDQAAGMLSVLHRRQQIPSDLATVWDFFSDPRNLQALTPSDLHFTILGDPPRMSAGQLIRYRIRIPPGLRVNWLTEIRHVRDGAFFVDEQRQGPYRLWYHEHRFTTIPGGVLMEDTVTYDVGWGVFGGLVDRWWVARRLATIFDFRFQAVEHRFGRFPAVG